MRCARRFWRRRRRKPRASGSSCAIAFLRLATSLYPSHRGAIHPFLDACSRTGRVGGGGERRREALPLDAAALDAAVGCLRAHAPGPERRWRCDLPSVTPRSIATPRRVDLLAHLRGSRPPARSGRGAHGALPACCYDGQVDEALAGACSMSWRTTTRPWRRRSSHQPRDAVPVLLLAREEYYYERPGGSGGDYDTRRRLCASPPRPHRPRPATPRQHPSLQLPHVFRPELPSATSPPKLQ